MENTNPSPNGRLKSVSSPTSFFYTQNLLKPYRTGVQSEGSGTGWFLTPGTTFRGLSEVEEGEHLKDVTMSPPPVVSQSRLVTTFLSFRDF